MHSASEEATISRLLIVLLGGMALSASAPVRYENGGIAPTRLGYARNPAVYAMGVEIEPNEPYVEGDRPIKYSVSPSLPEGLTLSPSTGVLTGTPTALTTSSDYTVTAQNFIGWTQSTLTLKIASTAPFVTNGVVHALLRAGSTLYLGGEFTQIGPPTGSAVMLDSKSGAKPGFAAWPLVNGTVDAVVADRATPGGFYVGGEFTQVGNVALNRIARILPNGMPDPSWNLNANGRVDSLAASEDGNTLYAGGAFTSIGGKSRNHLAALDASTGLATEWDPRPQGEHFSDIFSLAVSGNLVYASGNFASIGGRTLFGLAALDASTGLATDWNPNPNGAPYSLAVSGDGKTVYAGGTFVFIGGQWRNSIAALDASTGLATGWNPGAQGRVLSMALSDNTLYIGGSLLSVGGRTRNHLAAIDVSTGLVTDWNPNPNLPVDSLAVSGNTVYAGGYFTSIGGQSRSCLAALDASTALATDWNPNANDFVRSLAVSGNTVYAGGKFTSIGGRLRNRLAEVDTSTGSPTDWNPDVPNGRVNALAVSGDGHTVYAGGIFTFIGGQSRNYLAALDASSGSPTDWNPNPNLFVISLTISRDGNTVYAGGAFNSIGGQSRYRLAAIDASTGLATDWNPNPRVDGEIAPSINSLVVAGNTVYAGGYFTSIGGQARTNVAELDVAGRATGWNPNANSPVWSLAVSGDGKTIYAGGAFTSIGGQSRNYLAALDASTGLATDWNPNPQGGYFPDVISLAVGGDGNTIYAGGAFTSIGGQPRNYVAALDVSTALATDWNPDANDFVRSLALTGNTVYAGGNFTSIGGEMRSCFATLPDGSDRAD